MRLPVLTVCYNAGNGCRTREGACRQSQIQNMFNDIWDESSFAGAIYDIGFEEGLKRAREEAQMEGMRAFAQKVLERRFGPLSEELCVPLWAADKATLVDILVNRTTLDDVKKRLDIS